MIRVFSQDVSVKSLLLIVGESIVIVLSVILGARLRFWNDPVQFSLYADSGNFLLQVLTVLVVLETCCYYNDLYDLSVVRPRGEQVLGLAQALGAGCLLLGLLYLLFPGLLVGRGVLFIALALITVFIAAIRSGVDWLWDLTTSGKTVLILGDGETAITAARELERRRDLNFRIAGFVSSGSNGCQQLLEYPVLGHQRDLRAIARDQGISKIIVALEDFGVPCRHATWSG